MAASLPTVLPIPRPAFPAREAPVPLPVPSPAPKVDVPAPDAEAVPATGLREAFGRRAIAGIAIQVVLVVIVIKLVIDVAFGAVATPTLSTVYGAAYDTLPAVERQALDTRFSAIAGSVRGLSGADLRSKVQGLVDGGMARLDDPTLTEHERLWTAGFNSADTATCAGVARATLKGVADPPGIDTLLASQGAAGYGRWLEIQTAAMAAQVGNAPEARTASQEEADSMFIRLFAQVPASDMEVLRSEQDGSQQSDDTLCTAQRHFLAAVLQLTPSDLVTYEIWSVTPVH
jgi:hypothetical protein